MSLEKSMNAFAIANYRCEDGCFRISGVPDDAGFAIRAREMEGFRRGDDWVFPDEYLRDVVKILREKHGVTTWHRPAFAPEIVPVAAE